MCTCVYVSVYVCVCVCVCTCVCMHSYLWYLGQQPWGKESSLCFVFNFNWARLLFMCVCVCGGGGGGGGVEGVMQDNSMILSVLQTLPVPALSRCYKMPEDGKEQGSSNPPSRIEGL